MSIKKSELSEYSLENIKKIIIEEGFYTPRCGGVEFHIEIIWNKSLNVEQKDDIFDPENNLREDILGDLQSIISDPFMTYYPDLTYCIEKNDLIIQM